MIPTGQWFKVALVGTKQLGSSPSPKRLNKQICFPRRIPLLSGSWPIHKFYLLNVGKKKQDILICVLLDSGTSVPMLSHSLISDFKIPKVQQDVP
jgi:hypothetical protein